jgi:hypothetical protein
MVLACTVLHNYILGIDPYDRILNNVGSSNDITYDTQNYSSEHSGQPLSQIQQRAAHQEWGSKRESIALDMWNNNNMLNEELLNCMCGCVYKTSCWMFLNIVLYDLHSMLYILMSLCFC